MVDMKLTQKQTGYDAVAPYIRNYWQTHLYDTVLVALSCSYDGITYDSYTEIAYPYNYDDVEFLNDWWEGQNYIRIFGIKAISDINVLGGLGENEILHQL